MRYDKTPEELTTKEKSEWERGYDEGYWDGFNRYPKKCLDTETIAYQRGYLMGYTTGYYTE